MYDNFFFRITTIIFLVVIYDKWLLDKPTEFLMLFTDFFFW